MRYPRTVNFLAKGGAEKYMFQIIKKHHPLPWIYMNEIEVSDFAHRDLNPMASQDWSL